MTIRKNTGRGGKAAVNRTARAAARKERRRLGPPPKSGKGAAKSSKNFPQEDRAAGAKGPGNRGPGSAAMSDVGPTDTIGAFKGEAVGFGVKDLDTGQG